MLPASQPVDDGYTISAAGWLRAVSEIDRQGSSRSLLTTGHECSWVILCSLPGIYDAPSSTYGVHSGAWSAVAVQCYVLRRLAEQVLYT